MKRRGPGIAIIAVLVLGVLIFGGARLGQRAGEQKAHDGYKADTLHFSCTPFGEFAGPGHDRNHGGRTLSY